MIDFIIYFLYGAGLTILAYLFITTLRSTIQSATRFYNETYPKNSPHPHYTDVECFDKIRPLTKCDSDETLIKTKYYVNENEDLYYVKRLSSEGLYCVGMFKRGINKNHMFSYAVPPDAIGEGGSVSVGSMTRNLKIGAMSKKGQKHVRIYFKGIIQDSKQLNK